MSITRNDILAIAKKPYNLVGEVELDEIDYLKWVDFIESYPQYFTWYENTEEGREALKNVDKVPEWAKERVLYSLNKKKALCSNELMPNSTDLIITFSSSDKRVGISLERNISTMTVKILISMAKYLDALLLKNGKEIINDKYI